MCFFGPSKPKSKKKTRKNGWCGGASSSSSSSSRSRPPYNSWAQEERRYVQQSQSRAYEGVFEDIKHVDTLKTKLVPPPLPLVDVPKLIAEGIARAEQQRKDKERDDKFEKMMRDLKDRDERRDKQVAKADDCPSVQALKKMLEDDRKAREDRESRERDRKQWKREAKKQALQQIGGTPYGGLPAISHGGYNNSMCGIGNNSLPAPAPQGLLGWTSYSIEEQQRKHEREMDKRLKAMKEDQDDFKRQTLRSLQYCGNGNGYGNLNRNGIGYFH